jgi:uncharacterized membrane protein
VACVPHIKGGGVLNDDEGAEHKEVVAESVRDAAKAVAQAVGEGEDRVEEIAAERIQEALYRTPREVIAERSESLGDRAAGWVARESGSWPTIIGFLVATALYVSVNLLLPRSFDPTLAYYTFTVSVLAIFLSQVILLFQNRQADIESAIAHSAYHQTEEIHAVQPQQTEILREIDDLQHQQMELLGALHQLHADIQALKHALDVNGS